MRFLKWVQLRETDDTPSINNTPTVHGGSSGGLAPIHSHPEIEQAIQHLVKMRSSIAKLTDSVMNSGYFKDNTQFEEKFLRRMQEAADGVGRAHAILLPDSSRR